MHCGEEDVILMDREYGAERTRWDVGVGDASAEATVGHVGRHLETGERGRGRVVGFMEMGAGNGKWQQCH
jgi:hypothetical protein